MRALLSVISLHSPTASDRGWLLAQGGYRDEFTRKRGPCRPGPIHDHRLSRARSSSHVSDTWWIGPAWVAGSPGTAWEMAAHPRARLALQLLGVSFLLGACGGDDAPAERQTSPQFEGEFRGPAKLFPGGAPALRTEGTIGGSGRTLIVGSVRTKAPDSGVRLEIHVDGEKVAAQSAPLPTAPRVVVAACACRIESDDHVIELRLGKGPPTAVTGRSLFVTEHVVPQSPARRGLPGPLLTAAFDTTRHRIDAEAGTLLSARLSADAGRGPLLILGQVLGRDSTNVDLAAIQIDATVGAERLQPENATTGPSRFTAAYRGRAEPGARITLTAGTGGGAATVGPRILYACACALKPGY